MYLWRKLQMSRLQYSGLGAKKGDSGCAFRVLFFSIPCLVDDDVGMSENRLPMASKVPGKKHETFSPVPHVPFFGCFTILDNLA